MASERTVLAVASLEGERYRTVTDTVAAAGLGFRQVPSLEEAEKWLAKQTPAALLLDLASDFSQRVCQKLRSKSGLPNVPIIVFTDRPTDDGFARAFLWGADDLIAVRADVISARLASLPDARPSEPPSHRGEALVAHPDVDRCNVVGRVLRSAGYTVKYAIDESSARQFSGLGGVALVVSTPKFGAPRRQIANARESGGEAHWVFVADPAELDGLERSFEGMSQVAVVSEGDPPSNVLFRSNELGSSAEHGRGSDRVLFGTTVAFRRAGDTEDDFGYSYNVSRSGLYIRTLAKPPEDTLWLELQSPLDGRFVRVEARPAWNRPFSQSGTATVPPGFGVEIQASLTTRDRTWQDIYDNACQRGQLSVKRSTAPPHAYQPSSPPPAQSTAPSLGAPPVSPGSSTVLLDPTPQAKGTLSRSAPPKPTRSSDSHGSTVPSNPPSSLTAPPLPKRGAHSSRPPPHPAKRSSSPAGPPARPDGRSPRLSSMPPPKPKKKSHSDRAPESIVPRPVTAKEAPHDSLTESDFDQVLGTAPRSEELPKLVVRAPPKQKSIPPGEQRPPAVAATKNDDESKMSSGIFFLIVLGVVVGGGFAVFSALGKKSQKPPEPPAPVAARAAEAVGPRAALVPQESKPIATAPASTAVTTSSAVPPLAEPSTSSAVTPPEPSAESAPATEIASATVPPVAAKPDTSGMRWDLGLIYVQSSSTKAIVYVQGIEAGPTNRWHELKCGTRWVRLALPGPKWISEGRTVTIECQEGTSVAMEPSAK